MDSVIKAITTKNEFVEIKRKPLSVNKPIRANLEVKNFGEKFITVRGWAFIDSTQNNKGDSIFFTLSSSDKFYLAKAEIYQRLDITTAFSKQYLDDAGMKIIAFTDDVEKGKYQLGIAIKNKKGQFFSQLVGDEIKVKLADYSIPEKLFHLPPLGKVIYDVNVNENNNEFLVDGWAALENQNANSSKISIILKSIENIYQCSTDPFLRHDVTTYFKSKHNFDNSGYSVKLRKSALPKGKYQIGFIIKDEKQKTETYIFTPKEIIIL